MRLAHIIPLSIIPGPKAAKDFNSFLWPFVDECKKLVTGVWAFNAHTNEAFKLHIYPILVHGDMMAIKHVMNFKGPNGKSPCCCERENPPARVQERSLPQRKVGENSMFC